MKLIDAEELEKATCGRCKESKDGKWSIDCLWISCQWGDVMPVIQKLPIVDAEPVAHGEWIVIDDCEKFIAKCSVCGRIEDSRLIVDYPYCHCGAKMDGGK